MVGFLSLFNVGYCYTSTWGYPAPSSLTNLPKGTIIAAQRVPNWISGFGGKSINTWQIMFRTENTAGYPIAGITTVVIPFQTRNFNPDKLISYQFHENSACDKCAPSVHVQTDPLDNMARKLISKGYTLVIPDHEGQYSAFGAGILQGKITLDSMRAVLQSQRYTGIKPTAKWVISGYSGGSVPSGWAAQMLDTYAPDLRKNVIGAVIGGVVADLTSTLRKVHMTYCSGYIPTAIVGLCSEYPNFNAVIQSEFRNGKSGKFDIVRHQCSKANLMSFMFQNVLSNFKSGSKIMDNPVVKNVLGNVRMGSLAPTIPMFVYHSSADEVADVHSLDSVVTNWCSAGTNIHYIRLPGLTHTTAFQNAFDAAIEFINQAFAGKQPSNSGCKVENRLLSLRIAAKVDSVNDPVADAINKINEMDKVLGGG